MEIWYQRMFAAVLVVLALIMVIYVIRSLVGPTLADRILAVNAIGTLTIVSIAVLAMSKKESYLMDVCMIYAMLSFLAIVVLTAFVTRERLEIRENPEVLEEADLKDLDDDASMEKRRRQRIEEAETGFTEELIPVDPETEEPEPSEGSEEERTTVHEEIDPMIREAREYLEKVRKGEL